MLAAIFIYLFCEFFLTTNGWLSYKLYRSAHNPDDLQVKIDGSILLGDKFKLPQFRAEKESYEFGDTNILSPLEDAVQESGTEDIGKETHAEQKKNVKEKYSTDKLKRIDNTKKNDKNYRARDDRKQNIKDHNNKKRVKGNTSTGVALANLKEQLISLKNMGLSLAGIGGTTYLPTTRKTVGKRVRVKNNYTTNKTGGKKGRVKNTPKVKVIRTTDVTLFPKDSKLRIGHGRGAGVTRLSDRKRHKVQNDARVRKFTEHIYKQTLQAFDQMKHNSDPYTRMQIDSLADTYKKKFSEFVRRTRQTDIKTSQGTHNVIMHTLDTSNLIFNRIMNYLKSEIIAKDNNVPRGLREGGASKIDKEVDSVRETEHVFACKKFGVCRSSEGFRTVLQDIISLLLKLPDKKLILVNDAATEVLRNADLSTIADSVSALYVLNRAIKHQERTDVRSLRNNLGILYGVLSKSHLPLIIEKGTFARPAVKRTVSFRELLDELETALPPSETNKREWALVKDRLNRWKDDAPLNIQEILQLLVDNIQRGVAKNNVIKRLVEDMVEANTSIGAWF